MTEPFRPPFSIHAFATAALAAFVGFGSTIALIIQANIAIGANPSQINSAVTALCLGIGLFGALLSAWLKAPVVLGWSTPGAALLATSLAPGSYAHALMAFALAGCLTLLVGLLPALQKIALRTPAAIASGMLAGILFPFCLAVFRTLQTEFAVAGGLLLSYLVVRRLWTQYALLITIPLTIIVLALSGKISWPVAGNLHGTLSFTAPEVDGMSLISVGIPLFLVTLTSQNLPGLMVLHSAGYRLPARPLLCATGLISCMLAPFGAHGINLAAMTAALCTGESADPDPNRRWMAGLCLGLIYLGLAAFSAPLVRLFLAVTPETMSIITGIAMIGPMIHALNGMMSHPEDLDAAVLSFMATASGITLFGIGAAFWGLLVGFFAFSFRKPALSAIIGKTFRQRAPRATDPAARTPSTGEKAP